MTKKPSIQDIAREVGLSRNTVAKAIKGDPGVSAETRGRVLRAALAANYPKLRPEAVRALRAAAPAEGHFAVLIEKHETASFWNRIIVGISDELDRNGASCAVHFISAEDKRDLRLPSSMRREDLRGIACLSVLSEGYVKKLLELDVPVIFYDAPVCRHSSPAQGGDVILAEGRRSVNIVASDLIARGYRQLGFIGDITYCQTIFDRWQGFCDALAEHGLPINERFCHTRHVASRYYGYDELSGVLSAMPELPEAIVCANDAIAFNLFRYCKQRGIRIPDDLAVTGFDNTPELIQTSPPLTTVNITNYWIGCRLVQQLLLRIRHPEMPREFIYLLTEPTIRESSGIDRTKGSKRI
ncbi:MAG: LacI family transcriptional regulator [Clostridiales bacterium]|nr:LacI family transcriptional regulator [Clostridiales bacterium]